MFTDSFWTSENEFAWEALNGGPSPIAQRKAAKVAKVAKVKVKVAKVKADPTAALLEKRETLASKIQIAEGRKLTSLIGEMVRLNEQLSDLGFFPKGI
jgi:hypothetical protein